MIEKNRGKSGTQYRPGGQSRQPESTDNQTLTKAPESEQKSECGDAPIERCHQPNLEPGASRRSRCDWPQVHPTAATGNFQG